MTAPKKVSFDRFDVSEKDSGKTVATAIRTEFPDWSWKKVQALVRNRHVQVSGNLCNDHARRVRTGEPIKVFKNPLPKPLDSSDVKILYADPHLVVLEKPARITSVRHLREKDLSQKRRQLQPTLDELVPEALAFHFKRQNNPDFVPRPIDPPNRSTSAGKIRFTKRPIPRQRAPVFPVHRLDRDTSGIMLMARNAATRDKLVAMFRHHDVDRRYTAIVHGQPEPQTISTWFVRDRGDGLRGSLMNEEGGLVDLDANPADLPEDAQRAITHVRPLRQLGPNCMVECRLETGRTHQIRIHLAEAGFPILGESMYWRTRTGQKLIDPDSAPRQALHAHACKFTHPISGQEMKFQSNWPKDLQSWLDELQS